jgi:hypothetical protein
LLSVALSSFIATTFEWLVYAEGLSSVLIPDIDRTANAIAVRCAAGGSVFRGCSRSDRRLHSAG